MPDLSLIHRAQPARSGSVPHPGLVLLHGLGSNELDLLSITPAIDGEVYIISARAPLAHPWGGYSWYDLERHGPGLGSESIESALGLLDRFLTEVVEVYPIDPRRLVVGGFSMGAAMAGAVGLLFPRKVAAVVMASGYLPPDSGDRYLVQEVEGMPIFQAHGLSDPVVSIEYARQTRDFLLTTAANLTYREYRMGHEVSFDEMRDLAAWFSQVLQSAEAETPPA